jgi:deazaflavin-dependent oxidoreductase (nitroreductase family)
MSEQITDSPEGWVAEHTKQYVETGGKEGHEWRPGVPTLLLTTTGRTSGIKRRTALIYGRDNDRYVIVASKGGDPEHPQWYRNLLIDPEVEVQVMDDVFPARAETAKGEERTRLWALMRQTWPAYDSYQEKTDREIPVVILTPLV